MKPAWNEWLRRFLQRLRLSRHRRWEKRLFRHEEKYQDVLPAHYALMLRLEKLGRLPSIPYDYRLGQRILVSVFYSNWGEWQGCALEATRGLNERGIIEDKVSKKAAVFRRISLDEYLLGHQPVNRTLDEFVTELVRDGIVLLEAIRVAEETIDANRLFYYRTRCKRLVKDLDELCSMLTNTAMDLHHE